ncbi:MAG TPA: hypothetical protein VNN72_05665 [Polyangiaceae bacterium]|nr:hypothetical protein [Polyangiaceae bacterium]
MKPRIVNRWWWLCGALSAAFVACGGDDDAPPAPQAGAAGKAGASHGGSAGSSGAAGAGAPSDSGSGGRERGGSAGQATGGGTAGTSGEAGASAGAGTGGRGGGGAEAGTGGGAGSEAGGGNVMAEPTFPKLLSETGLYSNLEDETLADGVLEYHPSYELWSDGATKRRWVKLPVGATIDTTDMDFWVYPEGTKLFKEFTVGATRVETRMLHKQKGGWAMVAYLWNDDQTDATAAPMGKSNASGTLRDVPSRATCNTCHAKMQDIVLGFTALQLSHGGSGVTLDSLASDGALSSPPADALVVPGDDTAQAALGYLHANCGICHNEHSFVSAAVDVKFWLTADHLGSVTETPTYTTAVGKDPLLGLPGADSIIAPGEPDKSSVVLRMQLRGDEDQMPPIASEEVDTTGVDAVSAWIDDL